MTAPLMDKSKLREELAKVLQKQWAGAYKAGQNGKMLAQLITEPIIEDATLNHLIALTDSYYLGLIPEKRRVNHDRCTWIENGVCQAHGVKLTDKEIGVIFYENEIIDRITSILTNNGGAE